MINAKVIGAGVFLVIILALIFSPVLKKKTLTEAEKIEKTYQEATQALDEGDFDEALEKLDEIIASSPGYKSAGVFRLDAKKKSLLKAAKSDMTHKKPTDAIDKLRRILVIDPADKQAKARLNEATKLARLTPGTTTTLPPADTARKTGEGKATAEDATKSAKNSPDGQAGKSDSTTTTQPLGGAVAPSPQEVTAKPIPEKATPLTLMPRAFKKFRLSQTGWSQPNLEAEASFLPVSSADRKKISAVFVAVGKYPKGPWVDRRLDEQRQRFPNESDAVTVNAHPAYFGLYFEDRPKVFPPAATVAWLSGNWYFGVTVIPADHITSAVKREYGVEIAQELGY